MSWVWLALLSALAAGVTATLGKAALEKVDANVGFAVQSVVILLLTWAVIAFQGNVSQLKEIQTRDWIMLAITGAVSATGYMLYFGAIKAGAASQAAPVDRLSLVFAIVFAAIFLKEKLTPQIIFGAVLMAAGAVLIAMVKTDK